MMTKSKPGSRERNKGMLLFIAIFLMLVLFMISSAFVSMVCNDYYTSSLGISATEVFWFADAGVDYMIEEIRAYGIYSPFVPDDLNGYDSTGWGQVYVSDCLLKKGRYEGYFDVKVQLHPDDWRGRGQTVLGETYPAPFGALNAYAAPSKFRPYLLQNNDKIRGPGPGGISYDPRLNRLIILSTGFFMVNTSSPAFTGNRLLTTVEEQDLENRMNEKKSIFAVYSMTTENLEWWTEKLH
jgi:hypothetical protein